jgi:flagellar biosynthetic protein FliP
MKPSSRMLNGMAGRRPARAALLLVACLLAVPAAAAGDAIPIPPVPATPAKVLAPVALERTAAAVGTAARPITQPMIDWKVLGVLAAAFAAVVVLRMASRKREPTLPPDVFDVLGTASLGGNNSVRIVRFGPKTLLVSVSAGGCQTLSELSDPQATACIAAACRGTHPPLRPRAADRPAITRAVASLILVTIALAAPALAADAPTGSAVAAPTPAAVAAPPAAAAPAATDWAGLVGGFLGTRSLDTALSAALMFGVASLAPAVLLMTTSFVRMSVVLSLLRQGLGTQQLPSNQIITSLALFLSALVMWPIWTQAYRDGVEPYQQGQIELATAYDRGTLPIRRWMAGQIEQSGNRDTMLLFLSRHPAAPKEIKTYDDVPVETLLPAFLVSELKTAFSIGFRLILPFLVLDVIVATLVVSTGLVMLPPTLVSLPLKLLVFVMADGWSLVVQTLLDSMRATAS